MALFKIYRGDSSELPGGANPEDQTKMHDGYAYFCTDSGEFFIDVNFGGSIGLQRVQVNALAATKLSNGATTIEIDDIVLTTDIIDVAHGGTGRNSLTVNAVLVGDGSKQVKLIPANLGAFYVDTVNGVPKFGVLPVAQGGIGANDAAGARSNLDLYSKGEVDNKVDEVTTMAYSKTLAVSDWLQASDGGYVATWTNSALQCGKNHNVPPEITYTSNKEEYSKITKAEANTDSHTIKFYIDEKPKANIGIIVIDQR